MKVVEIFLSLQGEAKESGEPTIFIRFCGCDLRCDYCDTKYAYEGGQEMSPDDIMEKVRSFGDWMKNVCITGGEPLVQDQDELIALMIKLKADGFHVSLETNGARDISLYADENLVDSVVMDWKLESSGVSNKMLDENIMHLRCDDQVKFVVGSEKDFEEALRVVESIREEFDERGEDPLTLIFSTVYEKFPLEKLAELILKNKVSNAKMQVQLHKVVWGKDKQGV